MDLKNDLKEEDKDKLKTERLLYPRVSDILYKQTERELRSIPLDTLASASIRGTKIHNYCTAYLKGLWLPDIEPNYLPYVNAFIDWCEKNIYKTLYLNTRLYDDVKRFTGEFDCIVMLKDSKQIALLDIKTSANVSKSWPIQLAAYKHLCNLNGYSIDAVYNIHLKKIKNESIDEITKSAISGFVKPILIDYKEITPYWEIFSSALTCYYYFDKKEKVHVID